MPESRLPADQQRRLAVSFAVSLLMHAAAWNLLGSSGLPPSGSFAAASPPGLSVSLVAAMVAPPLPETAQAPASKPAEVIPLPAPASKPVATTAGAPASAPAASVTRTIDAAVGLSGIVSGPWYYPARYLHRHPTPLRPILPAYPSQVSDITGHVVLLLFINEKGSVDSHRILKGEPAGVFEDAVVAAFVGERFAPGLILAQAVKSQLLLEVFFEHGTAARVNVLADPPR